MELFYFTRQEELDNFIKSAADKRGAEFLQSWQWGEILKSEKAAVLRIGVRRKGDDRTKNSSGREILVAATIIKYPLGVGFSYWYAPRGVILNRNLSQSDRTEAENYLFLEIKKIDSLAVFMRFEPAKDISGRIYPVKKVLDLQPKQTLILDLDKDEAGLLQDMRQKARYNLNLAVKKGVETKEGSVSDFSDFWRLMSLTGERDDFRLHGEAHYRNLLQAGQGLIRLYFAAYEGRNVAAGIFCFWGDKVTYLHGASDNQFRNVMAPYLLQWSVIRRAKKEKYKYYDFYGLDERKWPGVTRFKLGFGGRPENYPGTYDLIFRSALYYGYGIFRKIRRLLK